MSLLYTSRSAQCVLWLFCLLLCSFTATNAQTTEVDGVVSDAVTGETLPFANVIFTGSTIGTITDIDGKYALQTSDPSLNKLTISFLGYREQTIDIAVGEKQNLDIKLESNAENLQEVVIKAKKKIRKDTAAIRLYRRILENKDSNSPDDLPFYSYEDYTKTEFDIFNIKKSFKDLSVFKPFDFVFENIDTTEAGIPFLPVMLKERIADVFYRKDPNKTKEIVKADQFSGVKNMNMNEVVNYSVGEIDIYKNIVEINGKGFKSPFSKGALASYKFFLTDSSYIDGEYCYKLEFTSRRDQDLCFSGHAWVDSETAGVKRVEMFLLDQVNLNFINNLKIKQDFTKLPGKKWFKKQEQMEFCLNLTESKKRQSVRVLRTSSRDKINIDDRPDDDRFKGSPVEIQEGAYERADDFWVSGRHNDLNKHESRIYSAMDSLQNHKTYKKIEWWAHFGASGYGRVGPIELGRYFQAFSWNEIEGNRYRLGFRTNRRKVGERWMADGYLAYGDKDKFLKYSGAARYKLNEPHKKRHEVGARYTYDWSNYNFRNTYLNHDFILMSILRNSPMDNLLLIREGTAYHEREWFSGFFQKTSLSDKKIYSWPGLYSFNEFTGDSTATDQEVLKVFELNLFFSYGIGQKFIERGMKREAFSFSKPVLDLSYSTSLKGILGSDFSYHKFVLTLKQQFNTQLGKTNYELVGGKIFGRVPYPLLKIHAGNESYGYDKYGFNIMNEMEYANDTWASLWLRHRFEGLLFNMVPGVKKLKMRTVLVFRGAVGDMSDENKVYLQNSNELRALTEPYAEVGVGVENILKLFQLYSFWRVTQHDRSDITRWGIRFYVSPSF